MFPQPSILDKGLPLAAPLHPLQTCLSCVSFAFSTGGIDNHRTKKLPAKQLITSGRNSLTSAGLGWRLLADLTGFDREI